MRFEIAIFKKNSYMMYLFQGLINFLAVIISLCIYRNCVEINTVSDFKL